MYLYNYVTYIYMYYIEVGFCTLKTDTQEVHPRNLNFMKLQVSQDTNVELNSEDEKNSDILNKKNRILAVAVKIIWKLRRRQAYQTTLLIIVIQIISNELKSTNLFALEEV